MKYYIRTYGCQMNVHESEKLTAQLTDAGFEPADCEKDAEIIIFNTCCIRNTAEQKIISHIGETKPKPCHSEPHGHPEARNLSTPTDIANSTDIAKQKIICVVGCLSQRAGSAAAFKKKFPHIAIILGTHNIGSLAAKLRQYIDNQNGLGKDICKRTRKVTLTEIQNERTAQDSALSLQEAQATNQSLESAAFINITYGCENYCSYCIVPYVRGKLISRDSAYILQEFSDRMNTAPAPAVIMLLGQNVNSYVCPRTGMDFPALLETLCKQIPNNSKTLINFLSSHPKDFSARLINTIAKYPEIERNIHLPLQSGCDRILKLMNRKYTVAEYEEKINQLRTQVPGVHITTDIICGFPTETEEEFAKTIETIKRIRFNAAFIFPYSRRTGTAADKMPDQIDAKTKKARSTELIRIQREISKSIK